MPQQTAQRAATAIRAELRRRAARTDFGAWCQHALAPFGHAPAAHHRLLIRELERVARGETPRLMIFMPPGSAKTTYVSKLFAAWWMAQAPHRMIVAASHTQTFADKISAEVQAFVRDNADTLGYGLASEAREMWRTTNGGQYRAAGVGAKITGFRAGLALLDDLVPGAEGADSEKQRESIWDWYLAELDSRLVPGAPIILVMTRWHEDDIAGRLLTYNPGVWRIIKLPAVAGGDDPLGRQPGELLWTDDDYGYGAHVALKQAELERAGASRYWAALYQQEPRPPEGTLFRVTQISVLDAAPACTATVRAWDLAATAATGGRDPDWTAGVKLGRTAEGRWIALDVVRLRGGPEDVEAAIVNTAAQDGRSVAISLPQDPGQAGRSQVLYLTRRLAGYRVESSPETGDKATRAMPIASQVNVGNVSTVKGAWNAPFFAELRDFPSGTHDDQVDALSRAFAVLTAAPKPAQFRSLTHMSR